jgi:hypothetical protein
LRIDSDIIFMVVYLRLIEHKIMQWDTVPNESDLPLS